MDTLRIGDADREHALALLGDQYVEGRLTKDELDERSDAVWSARTRGDLVPLFADLPVRPGVVGLAGTRSGPPSRRVPRRHPAELLRLLAILVIAAAVITHLPFVLLALAGWFLLSRRGVVPPPRWGHGGRGHGGVSHRC